MSLDLVEPNCGDVINYTSNLFAPSRKIYFFSDSPHLLKTIRNCYFNSGSGNRTRNMWNNDKYMLWDHIAKLFCSDLDWGLHQLPKLKVDHIVLKSYSKMKVSLAVQVLQRSRQSSQAPLFIRRSTWNCQAMQNDEWLIRLLECSLHNRASEETKCFASPIPKCRWWAIQLASECISWAFKGLEIISWNKYGWQGTHLFECTNIQWTEGDGHFSCCGYQIFVEWRIWVCINRAILTGWRRKVLWLPE